MSDDPKDDKKEEVTPQSLITEEHVRKALAADKGDDAILESWVVEDFTKKGDNYACVVSSTKVKFSQNKKIHDVTYVVKLNPCRKMESYEDFWHMLFVKELKFYTELVPELNSILESIGQPLLRVPQAFHGGLEDGKEFIFLEDLRKRDFKMFDRKKGMDMAHLRLVLQELGRLHAASVVLQAKYESSHNSIVLKHDYLKKDWMTMKDDDGENIVFLFSQYLDNSIALLKKATGYEKAIDWIESLKGQLKYIMGDQMESTRCNVVCHGDCWNNNILFKYDEKGHPIDLMLLDLQLCRYSSPATDLNYFLYSSVEGQVRKPNLETLLSIYHSSFKNTMDAGGKEVPYTEEETKQEFKGQHKFAAVFAMMLVPIVLMESGDVPDMSETTDDSIQELVDEFKNKVLKTMDTNPIFKPRFLSIFDEFCEAGYFDQK